MKSIKIVPINPPESSSFDVFVKVWIGDIDVRNLHSSWLRKFSMYSYSLSYKVFSNFFNTKGRMLTALKFGSLLWFNFSKTGIMSESFNVSRIFLWTERKTEKFRYDLKEKLKISEISEFLILLYTQNQKLGNIGKFYFNANFDSLKSKRMRYGSRRKKQIALPL